METVKASAFKKRASPELRDMLIEKGAVPVNDLLRPLWNNIFPILLLFGSYGSGKSVFLVDDLINKCIELSYFRCYFGRKVLDKVRGSVFQTITDRIKELKKEELFDFSDKPNGTMVITCKKNGHFFAPFGADNTESLKSIKDPTHFFCEELDQFTFTDFGDIFSRLRKEDCLLQLYAAFNTERIYQSHWIRKVFWDGEYANQAVKVKVNYTSNHFIDQDAYYKKLQLIANGDAVKLNAIANGEWGVVRTGGEFWKQFDETKHVRPLTYQPGVIWLSLDENVNPYVTCTCWQIIGGKDIKQIKEILCKSPDNNAPKAAGKVADWLQSINHKDMVFVCGDPSASKRSTVDVNSSSFYDKFIEVLRDRGFKVANKVMKAAPEVALSAAFINSILENNIYGWTIQISDMCFASIEDYIMVKEDAEGKMQKDKVKDEDTNVTYEPRGHISDSFRYLCLTAADKEWQDYRSGMNNKTLINKLGYFR